MEESKFQEYYKQVCERDRKMADEKPLPVPEETNVWTMFGLALGIASILFGFFTKYDIILGLFALVLSIVGNAKKKDKAGMAAIICSGIGIGLAIALAVVRYFWIIWYL